MVHKLLQLVEQLAFTAKNHSALWDTIVVFAHLKEINPPSHHLYHDFNCHLSGRGRHYQRV